MPAIPDLSAIDTLSLDAGSVLVFPNWDRVSDALARQGIHADAALLRRVEPPVRRALDEARQVATSNDAQRGGVYFDGVLDAAGVARGAARDRALADVYAYHAEHNLWESVPPDVPAALETFRQLGLRMVVASNANGVVHRALERGGLTRYFEAVCDSCIEGVEKPDPRFFAIVVGRAGGRPATTLHVGDLYYVDVAGARAAGLHAVLLDPHDLYPGADVARVASLHELAGRLANRSASSR
jgi:HAD superfamily hydrolase (TIGR01509 family)